MRQVRWWRQVGVVAMALGAQWASGTAAAQVRCTMPNGVVITQQLGDCPRDAVGAQRLDGTPVPVRRPANTTPAPQSAPSAEPAPAKSTSPAAPERDSNGLSFLGVVAFLLTAYGLYLALKSSTGVSGPVRYCTTCGHEGQSKLRTRGSLAIEIVLWLSFLVPGLIYSLWRHGSKHRVCASCGATSLVPPASPLARASRHSAAPPQEEPRARKEVPTDAWEGSFYDAPAQRTAKKTARIIYRDANGTVTERVVDIRAFEPEGASGMVIGWCQLRDATRTFRFDRMVRVVDEETGEIIPDLQAQLNAEWQASPEPVLDALYRKHSELLKIVLYAAKADGAVRTAELQVIANHCTELTGDDRITPALVRELLAAFDVPSIASFTRLYNKLRRERPDMATRAARACREIVATQKTVHPAEQVLLDALDKPLPAARISP